MIEYALLIMLGFCTAGLIAFLLAPTLYHRAVRLTTKRLEATMPMTLSEIEADKDLLRASYAIKIRRLEAGLNKARDKSANQLVEISKHQVRIAEMNQRIAELNGELEERRNAANVFESTIRKRFPELETMLATASAALDERAAEIADLGIKLTRREEALDTAQRSTMLQQEEIRKLRDTLERSGADATGRFKKRPSQWGLDEYSSEYDRLNVELSKMREQLILAQDREKRQIAVLKTELQQLAERIMASAAAERAAELRVSERAAGAPARSEPAASRPAPRTQTAQSPVTRPVAGATPRGTRMSSRMATEATRNRTPEAAESVQPTALKSELGQPATLSGTTQPIPAGLDRPVVAKATAPEPANADAEDAGRTALKSLLDRGSRLAGKELLEKAEKAAQGLVAGAGVAEKTETVPAEPVKTPAAAPKTADGPVPAVATAEAPAAETVTVGSVAGEAARQEPVRTEPQLDRVFREIIEGRAVPQPAAPPTPEPVGADAPAAEISDAASAKADSSETSKTKTLLDRLRHIQERQTG